MPDAWQRSQNSQKSFNALDQLKGLLRLAPVKLPSIFQAMTCGLRPTSSLMRIEINLMQNIETAM